MALSHTDRDSHSPAGARPVGATPLRPTPPRERKGPGAAILLVLAPLVCCAPLILAALATVSVATLGTVGGVVAAVLVAVAAALWVRHRRRRGAACCPPVPRSWRL